MATETAPRLRGSDGSRRQRTIAALWREAVAAGARRQNPAYLVETEDGWEEVSWAEAGRRVDELAHGLLALGIAKGEAVAVLARTRLEWALLDFALAQVGAVTAPVYANNSPRDCAYVIDHSEAVAVFVEDETQLAKIDEVRDEIPRVRHVLTFAGLTELAERGRGHARAHPNAVAEAAAAVAEDDLYTFIYTSGTTGPPKACMLLHRNYYEMAAVVDELEDFVSDRDVMLLYLPLAHNFGRLMSLIGPHVGFTIAFVPDPLRIADALPQVRPTVMPSAPRVYEKVYAGVKAQFDAATGVKRRLIDWAVALGSTVGRTWGRASAMRSGSGTNAIVKPARGPTRLISRPKLCASGR